MGVKGSRHAVDRSKVSPRSPLRSRRHGRRTAGAGSEGSEDRARLKAALKRLRERSLREYEVLYRILALGHSVNEVTEWLNERAIRGKHPERYRQRDTMVIVYAAVDKIHEWY